MLYKNVLWISLLLFSSAGKSKWVVSETSSLSVNGSTNVNKFSCDIPAYDQTDTLTMIKGDKGIALTGNIGLKVESFDCHNGMMTRNLQKTLKAAAYPRLYIHFLTLSAFPELAAEPKPITGWVNIELAGATKKFEINYKVSIDAQKVIHLIGTQDIKFSDFNLIPPRKLGGMIKTNDLLNVAFHLKMEAI